MTSRPHCSLDTRLAQQHSCNKRDETYISGILCNQALGVIYTSSIRVFPLAQIDPTDFTFKTRKVETFSSTQRDLLVKDKKYLYFWRTHIKI